MIKMTVCQEYRDRFHIKLFHYTNELLFIIPGIYHHAFALSIRYRVITPILKGNVAICPQSSDFDRSYNHITVPYLLE